jgi:hypothetical protein
MRLAGGFEALPRDSEWKSVVIPEAEARLLLALLSAKGAISRRTKPSPMHPFPLRARNLRSSSHSIHTLGSIP